MVRYQQGKHTDALSSLTHLIDPERLTLKSPLPERSRIEGLNTMALASLKAKDKDMERSIHFWKAGITGARALQSEQRFSEALVGYEIMEAVWPGEKTIKGLQELTVHW